MESTSSYVPTTCVGWSLCPYVRDLVAQGEKSRENMYHAHYVDGLRKQIRDMEVSIALRDEKIAELEDRNIWLWDKWKGSLDREDFVRAQIESRG